MTQLKIKLTPLRGDIIKMTTQPFANIQRTFTDETPIEIQNYINQALKHLPPLGFDIQLAFERVSGGKLKDVSIGAVTDGPHHLLTVNMDWYERTESQDIYYIIWHEIRHMYQWSQIEKLDKGERLSEAKEIIEKWKYETYNYIPNTPKTENQHMKQEIEIDAYAFAVSMLFRYCAKPDGSINIGLPPMTEAEIMNRAQRMCVVNNSAGVAGQGSAQKQQPIVKGKKIGRNEMCPCGSGKKYKLCCGKNR